MKPFDIDYFIAPSNYDSPPVKRFYIKPYAPDAKQFFYFLQALMKLKIVDVEYTQHVVTNEAHYVEVVFNVNHIG